MPLELQQAVEQVGHIPKVIEEIAYTAETTVQPFTCCINIELWQPQVSAITEENIELFFGNPEAIKMVAESVDIYNTKRPHLALKYKTPNEVHQAFYS